MRILIVGAGAIGSAVGGALALAGHRVAFLGRPAYVDEVRERGLRLTLDGHPHRIGDVLADTKAGPLEAALNGLDLIIVTTKVHDTREACLAVREYGITTLVLQNGVGGDAIAAEVLEDTPILAGVTTWVVSTEAPGEYTVRGRHRGLALAPYAPTRLAADGFARRFREAGIRCRAYDDALSMRWSKLLLNMLGNAIPAILDLSPAEVFADRRLYALERAAFLEAVGVMRTAGIQVVDLPGYPVRALVALMKHLPEEVSRRLMARLIAGGRSGKAPSLQIDARRGRVRSEVTALNGAVAREAERLGIPAPDNAAICETLVGLLAGDVSRKELRHSPTALLRRVVERGRRDP